MRTGAAPSPEAEAPEPLVVDLIVALLASVVLTLAAIDGGQREAIVVYGIVHVVAAISLWVWATGSGRTARRQAALLAISAAFLGPIGAWGSVFCNLAEGVFRLTARPFLVWYAELFPEEEAERADLILNRLSAGGDPASGANELASFNDVVSFGSVEQKQAIVALIARRFTPAFAPALRKALQDPIPAVRVQAAAAAATIEARYVERAMALEQESVRRGHAIEMHRALGLHYEETAQSGLMEAGRVRTSEDQALAHFNTVLAAKPGDPIALASTGRLQLQRGEVEQAAASLEFALVQDPENASTAALYLEALMRLGRFEELRRIAGSWMGRFSNDGGDGGRLNNALQLWAKGAHL
jgi:tetratricopeptide (TPR) repeat protein